MGLESSPLLNQIMFSSISMTHPTLEFSKHSIHGALVINLGNTLLVIISHILLLTLGCLCDEAYLLWLDHHPKGIYTFDHNQPLVVHYIGPWGPSSTWPPPTRGNLIHTNEPSYHGTTLVYHIPTHILYVSF